MSNRFTRLSILWLCLLTCAVFGQDETRLYAGEIEVPGIGSMERRVRDLQRDSGACTSRILKRGNRQDLERQPPSRVG